MHAWPALPRSHSFAHATMPSRSLRRGRRWVGLPRDVVCWRGLGRRPGGRCQRPFGWEDHDPPPPRRRWWLGWLRCCCGRWPRRLLWPVGWLAASCGRWPRRLLWPAGCCQLWEVALEAAVALRLWAVVGQGLARQLQPWEALEAAVALAVAVALQAVAQVQLWAAQVAQEAEQQPAPNPPQVAGPHACHAWPRACPPGSP